MTTVVQCAICNGRGQVGAGTACPVCQGTGVSTPEQAAAHQSMLYDAAVTAAIARVTAQGRAGADVNARQAIQARQDAAALQAGVEAAARRAENAAATSAAAAQVVKTARAQAAGSPIMEAIFSIPPSPPSTTPANVLPGATTDPLYVLDTLLVRELDVWGVLNVSGGGGGGGTQFLFYDPVLGPGKDTLLMSVSLAAGTDQYGNPFTAGAATYSTANGVPVAVANQSGSLLFQQFSGGTWITVAALSYNTATGLLLTSTEISVSSTLTAVQPNVSPPTAETWHAMTLLNSWGTVAGWTTPSYELSPESAVSLAGRAAHATDGTQVIATLPAAYTPTVKQVAPVAIASGTITAAQTPRIQLDTAGNVSLFGVTGATTVSMDGVEFPLSLTPPAPPAHFFVGLGGNTVTQDGFGGSYPGEANTVDGYFTSLLQSTAPAHSVQKTFYHTGSQNWLGAGGVLGVLPTRDSSYIGLGTRLLVSLRPWQAVSDNYSSGSNLCSNKSKSSPSDANPPGGWTLANELAALQTQIGLYINQWSGPTTKLDVLLWQECNNASFFTNGAAYINYFNYYKAAVQHYAANNVGLVICLGFSGGNFSAYFPGGSAGLSYLGLDYYGNAYKQDSGAALTTVSNLAINAGIPFGVLEWGVTSAPPTDPGNFTTYVAALQSFFQSMAANKQQFTHVIYFNGPGPNNTLTPNNLGYNPAGTLVGASDPKIATVQSFFNVLHNL